jgi:hypothetical protein
MSLIGFSLAAGVNNVEDAAHATLLADRLLMADAFLRRMAFAVGLSTDDQGTLCVMILADRNAGIAGLDGDDPRLLPQVKELFVALQGLILPQKPTQALRFAPWLERIWVTPTFAPKLHAAPIESIASNPSGHHGKIGSNVSWPAGAGYLVAGHVADMPPGGSMTDQAGNLGTLSYHCDPTNGINVVSADVAVVSFGARLVRRYTALSAPLGPNANVTVQTARGGTARAYRTTVIGAMRYAFLAPPVNGTWGELYYASPCVTQPGDTGAPVEDASGALVGHVVAGRGYTYIQQADYQLNEIRLKSSAHATLGL